MLQVTARDIADCRDHLRRDLGQASATVNRCLVTLRRFFGWLAENGHLNANPARKVKQLRKQELAPKGLERSQVRKLLREVELRTDIRSQAIFNLFLFTGCRVSDLVRLDLNDLMIGVRSGTAIFRQGKGNKQRVRPCWSDVVCCNFVQARYASIFLPQTTSDPLPPQHHALEQVIHMAGRVLIQQR